MIEKTFDKEKIKPRETLIHMLLTGKNVWYTGFDYPHHFLIRSEEEKIKCTWRWDNKSFDI